MTDQAPVTAGSGSFGPWLSHGGRYLAFVSLANNLVTTDDRGWWLDVFVRDMLTRQTIIGGNKSSTVRSSH